MIIDVKSTKADDDRPTNPYELTELKPSRSPVVLGLLLTGLALYLKTVFPGWGPTPSSAAEPEPDEEKSAPKLVLAPSDNPLDPPINAQPVGSVQTASAKGYAGLGARLVDIQTPESFAVIKSPGLEPFKIQTREAALLESLVSPSGPPSANDNIAPAANASSLQDFTSGNPDIDSDSTDPESHVSPGDRDDDVKGVEDEVDDKNDDDDDDDDDELVGNRAPKSTGPVYLHDVFGCMAAVIALGELLRNATDPDGDALSIANLNVSSGTLTQTAEGWSFAGGSLGPITLTYEITDGSLSIVQHAYFNLLKNPPILGTPASDVLVGTECGDEIDGGGGNDNIDSRGGHDTIEGGAGDDHIVAGGGNDLIRAGDGNDIVLGGNRH